MKTWLTRGLRLGAGDGPDSAGDATAVLSQLIRERGPVLDMQFTHSLYKPLLARQRRDGVEVIADVSYGDDPYHRLDIYRPADPSAAPRGAMIFMHGGGFVRGDKSDRENIGQYFARCGWVVAVANYRLAPDHAWPAGAEDVIRAYQWLRDHAVHYGVAAERIVLAGESAGAAHVATAMLARRFHPKEGLRAAAGILVSGVYNVRLEYLAREQFRVATPDPRNEAYFGTDFERYAGMSTVELIDASPVPLLITFAELDLLQMQVQAGELFARLVSGHGFTPQLKMIRDHNHLTQVYAVNTGDESLSSHVLEFLRSLR